MKRVLSIAAGAALLITLLPIGVVAAHDNNRHGEKPDGWHSHKIVICHNGVKISVAKSSWTLKAHMKHGDFVVTPTTPCVPKPKPAKSTQNQCTFDGTASYYNATPSLLSTGPLHFSWDASTGVVASGGSWHEDGFNYTDSITSGSVTGTGTVRTVSLAFSRTVGPALLFSFGGTLTNGTALLGSISGSGQPTPNTFQATGTTSCRQATNKHGGHDDDEDDD